MTAIWRYRKISSSLCSVFNYQSCYWLSMG